MSRLPIRARLTFAFIAAMAMVLLMTSAFIYERVQYSFDRSLDGELRTRMAQLRDDVRANPPGADAPGAGPASRQQDLYAQVLDSHGRAVDTSPRIARPVLSPPQVASVGRSGRTFQLGSIIDLEQPTFRAKAQRLHVDGRDLVVVVAVRRDFRDEALRELLAQLALGNLASLLIASGVGYALTRAALMPVDRIRAQAERVSSTDGSRLDVPEPRDELSRLATTLNGMLDRLGASMDRERRFVADASHELRTPLALMKAEVGLALRRDRSHAELLAALESVREECDALIALSEHLLAVASAEHGDEHDVVDVQVRELLARPLERLDALVRDAGRRVRLGPGTGKTVRVEPRLVVQAVTGLVHNAIEHGEGDIDIDVAPSPLNPSLLRIHVRDGGEGIPAEFVERAFDRFARGDSARVGSGTGLGLAIVRAAARGTGGDAGIEVDATGRGVATWVDVPRGGVRSLT